MTYFSGGEVRGRLHPSLRTFIDCFNSNPLPRMYPRGGGPHDQDPRLMQDFRMILRIKGQCQELEDAKREVSERMDQSGFSSASSTGGGSGGLGGIIDQMMEEHELD